MLSPGKIIVNKQFPQNQSGFRRLFKALYFLLSIFAEVSRSGVFEGLDHILIESEQYLPAAFIDHHKSLEAVCLIGTAVIGNLHSGNI